MGGRRRAGNPMRLETKFLRLPTPVELGSRFGDWQVSWLGGWHRHRWYYLVMVVRLNRVAPAPAPAPRTASCRLVTETRLGRD